MTVVRIESDARTDGPDSASAQSSLTPFCVRAYQQPGSDLLTSQH